MALAGDVRRKNIREREATQKEVELRGSFKEIKNLLKKEKIDQVWEKVQKSKTLSLNLEELLQGQSYPWIEAIFIYLALSRWEKINTYYLVDQQKHFLFAFSNLLPSALGRIILEYSVTPDQSGIVLSPKEWFLLGKCYQKNEDHLNAQVCFNKDLNSGEFALNTPRSRPVAPRKFVSRTISFVPKQDPPKEEEIIVEQTTLPTLGEVRKCCIL